MSQYFSNPNVKYNFIFTFLQSFGRGIWLGNVLSAYIFFLAGESNIILGFTSAAIGVAMTLTVVPAGYFADKFRRDRILRLAGLIGAIGIVFTAIADTILLIFVALIFWGIFQGLIRPSLEAIFADSVTSGQRSKIYSWIHFVRQWSMAIGPFLNVILFLYLGDEWDIDILRSVMLVGLGISGLSLFPLFKFSDDYARSDAEKLDFGDNGNTSKSKYVPYLIITANLIVGIGAGMTIKFFPIFFLDVYGFKPILVQIVFGLSFIATGISGLAAQHASKGGGRPLIIFIVQTFAIISLFYIASLPVVPLLIIAFILRGALMNASQPLSRSILMDYVSKKNRAKWNSIEAVAWGLFWNFSASIGGYLVDFYGFSFTFIITGSVYIVGTLPFLFLIPLVAKEKSEN